MGQFKNLDTASADASVQKLINQQREAKQKILDKLGNYTMKIYVVSEENSLVELSESEYGIFYEKELYLIDIKGESHRHIVMWMGRRLNSYEITMTSKHFDELTNYTNCSEITRTRVQRGHEDDSFLGLFDHKKIGFVMFQGTRVSQEERKEKLEKEGALFKVISQFGEHPKCLECEKIMSDQLNSCDSYALTHPQGKFVWKGKGSVQSEVDHA